MSRFTLIFHLICLIACCCNHGRVEAQSAIVYSENFNNGTGGWVTGGYQPSWNHGAPTLPHIVSNGTACFATGDNGVSSTEPYSTCIPAPLAFPNGNYYNCCERSFVESPVIDLTGVTSPLVVIDINIYCEQTYDGAKMQLSLNGGVTWQDIGSYNAQAYQQFPSSINCREKNWYNKNAVNYLGAASAGCSATSYSFGGQSSGWSGGCSQDGSGSCTNPDTHGTNGWITATHCISAAANKPNVKIRVAFGAGSQVYSDGIAFDNVRILNALPEPDFTWSVMPGCEPALSFINTSGCAKEWRWNFGDNEISTLEHPSHVFPAPGNFNVTLTATDFCGGVVSTSKPVTVIPPNVPMAGPVTHTHSGICASSTDSIIIPLTVAGIPPYSISYAYNGAHQYLNSVTGNPLVITGLSPGVYENIRVTDANGCSMLVASALTIPFNHDSLLVETVGDTVIKIGEKARLEASANLPATFKWMPETSVDDPFASNTYATPDYSTVYTVVATGINGCSATASLSIGVEDKVQCNAYYIPSSFTPNGDGKNEKFQVVCHPEMQLENFYLKIYTRWGSAVYESGIIGNTWDGKNAPAGVYAVVAEFKCRNKSRAVYRGTLNLIR